MVTFPIQRNRVRLPNGRMGYRGLSAIPLEMIASHEAQALKNHSQSLQRLAERHGVCACEALAILEDRKWKKFEDHAVAEQQLFDLVQRFEESHARTTL